jgi:hypothetical protein
MGKDACYTELMRILNQKDLTGKERINMAKHKRKAEKRLGGRVEIPISARLEDKVLVEAITDSPPDVVDRVIVGHLDSAELDQLGLKAGWYTVFGERV